MCILDKCVYLFRCWVFKVHGWMVEMFKKVSLKFVHLYRCLFFFIFMTGWSKLLSLNLFCLFRCWVIDAYGCVIEVVKFKVRLLFLLLLRFGCLWLNG